MNENLENHQDLVKTVSGKSLPRIFSSHEINFNQTIKEGEAINEY